LLAFESGSQFLIIQSVPKLFAFACQDEPTAIHPDSSGEDVCLGFVTGLTLHRERRAHPAQESFEEVIARDFAFDSNASWKLAIDTGALTGP
jgi:hypothetical protein